MQHVSWDSNVVTQPMTYPQKRSTTAQHPGQHPRVHLCPAVVFGKSLELSFAIPHDIAWRCESKGAHWLRIYHDVYICFSYMFRNNSLINFWMSWGIIAKHTLNVGVGSTQVEVIAICNGEYIYIYCSGRFWWNPFGDKPWQTHMSLLCGFAHLRYPPVKSVCNTWGPIF